MTTVLADLKLGVMVSDSSISDNDRVWIGKKVFRHKGDILGFAGDVNEALEFLEWWKKGRVGKTPRFSHSDCLVLSNKQLLHFNSSLLPSRIERGIEAIGSGGKAAICTYEALGWTDPVQALKIVCKHDAGSRVPVRVYKLR